MRSDFLPYYKPMIEEDDIASVADSMRNGWLTTGPRTKEFEAAFAAVSHVKHAIAVNSCTAAIKLALIALGVKPGDEVIMPALTFVAGAECVKQLGAEPVFCDIDERTLGISYATIAPLLGPKTKVVIPMHYGGQPVGIRSIVHDLRGSGVEVLEDAAHAVGSLDGGEWPGMYSAGAAYSFYATKNITSAEGGMLLTNRDDVAEAVRILSLHGMDKDAWKRYTKGGTWKYDVVEYGYKCNLPDTSAALGLSQLRKLSKLQAARDRLADRYAASLGAIPGISPLASIPALPDRHSWCVYAIAVDEEMTGVLRDQLVDELRERNIGTSVHFIPTHLFTAYRNAKRGDLSVTERIWQQMLSLPLYPGMTNADVDDVIAALQHIVTRARSRIAPTAVRHTA